MIDNSYNSLAILLRKLKTICSINFSGAHPDDEHNDTIAFLSHGKGVSASIMCITRGNGGQNQIGKELGDSLGVLRTRELEEAAKELDACLFFIYREFGEKAGIDFGYSKTWEETYKKWDMDSVKERIVRCYRTFKPDVVVSDFQNVRTTHGHHQSVRKLILEVIYDVANPNAYPEHLKEGLSAWKIKKVYEPADKNTYTVVFNASEVDSVLGKNYAALGMDSRSMHKCQGMEVFNPYDDDDDGKKKRYYRQVYPNAERVIEKDFFDGLPHDYSQISEKFENLNLDSLQNLVDEICDAFPNRNEIAACAAKTIKKLDEIKCAADGDAEDLIWLSAKLEHTRKILCDILNASLLLCVDTNTAEQNISCGEKTHFDFSVYNGSDAEINDIFVSLNVPEKWDVTCENKKASLKPEERAVFCENIFVHNDAATFHPFREPLYANLEYKYDGISVKSKISFDKRKLNFAVLPHYSVKFENRQIPLLNVSDDFTVNVTVEKCTRLNSNAKLEIVLPEGFSSDALCHDVNLVNKGESSTYSFSIKKDSSIKSGYFYISAKVVDDAGEWDSTYQEIKYPHLGITYCPFKATVKICVLDVKLSEKKIGYISSGFDSVGETLASLGMNVCMIGDDELKAGDFSAYQSIVIGIRAYGFRDALFNSREHILKFVQNGGNVIVQYHKPNESDRWNQFADIAPYKLHIGTNLIANRITDEKCPVKLADSSCVAFSVPNKIDGECWENWVHERTVYEPTEWADEFKNLLVMTENGVEHEGMLLSAKYGKGRFTYTSMSLYRQVQALVSGGLKLFVNLIEFN